jgi:hypothetical protein
MERVVFLFQKSEWTKEQCHMEHVAREPRMGRPTIDFYINLFHTDTRLAPQYRHSSDT